MTNGQYNIKKEVEKTRPLGKYHINIFYYIPLGSPMRVEFEPFFWPIFWSHIKNMGIFGILGSGEIQNTSYFSIYVNFWPSYGHLKKKKKSISDPKNQWFSKFQLENWLRERRKCGQNRDFQDTSTLFKATFLAEMSV